MLASVESCTPGATVLALSGDLGAGKTTLTKAIAALLGVQDEITSPTFVIAKSYHTTHDVYKKLVHIDAYRIEDIFELGPIGLDLFLEDPQNLIVVEWPEMIEEKINTHTNTHWYTIAHIDEHTRSIVKK
jgi:tRNA threonylcarbamoyladenosine biosynthesis protein TsaE